MDFNIENVETENFATNDVAKEVEALPDKIGADAELGETENLGDIGDVEKWLPEINPEYSPWDFDDRAENNCGECALAVYQRTNGIDNGAVAELNTESLDEIPEMADAIGKEVKPTSPEEIEKSIIEKGDGACEVVGILRNDGPGHWFNVYNDDGKVYAVDGQDGSVHGFPDYGIDQGADKWVSSAA